MSETERYANHYLKQLAGSAADNGNVEMSESVQSGGVGLGTSNSITSRYLIPASINSRKSIVSVDYHGPGRKKKKKTKRNRKRKKPSKNVQSGGKRRAPARKKKRSPVYKGGGGNRKSKKKSGRFDNLRDNF